MSSSLITVLIVAFIGMVLGFLVATIANSDHGEEKNTNGKKKPPAYLIETARLWRDRRNGALLVEKNGRFLRRATGLSQMQQDELARAVKDLTIWLEDVQPPPDAATEVPPPVIITSPPNPTSPRLSSSLSPDVGSTNSANQPARLGVLQSVIRTIDTANVPKIEAQPKSIAAQIDEIIREKAYGTLFEQHAIRLTDTPDQGVVVYVGMDSYAGVDAVPDAEIRAFIRDCVAEWERRQARSR